MKNILIIVFLMLNVVLSAENLNERYTSEDAGFSIQFPYKWEVRQGIMGNDMVAMAPTLDLEDLFRENANIIFAKLDVEISKDQYYSYNMNSLAQLLTDFDLEENEDVNLDGEVVKRIVFTHTMGIVNAKVLQYLVLVGNKAFVLTFTADPLDFDRFRPSFEEIAQSFKFPPVSL